MENSACIRLARSLFGIIISQRRTQSLPRYDCDETLQSRRLFAKLNTPTLIIDTDNEALFDRRVNGLALYQSLKGRVTKSYKSMKVPAMTYVIGKLSKLSKNVS
jgi:hypothetical protein